MARRGHGEGTIYQRKTDGRWVAMMSLPSGKRKAFYGDTRQEVAKRLTQALHEQEQGLGVISDERQTLASFLEGWLTTLGSLRHLESRTVDGHRSHVQHHILPALGNLRLTKLTTRHVEQFYAALMAKGLASTTVHHVHETLHKALEDAVRMDILPRNVSDKAQAPGYHQRDMQVLNQEQARQLRAVARGTSVDALVMVALSTGGMRQGELLGLRWRDVDLDAGVLSVRQALTFDRITHQYRFKEPKNKRSRRQIKLTLPAIQTLRHHRAQQEKQRVVLGTAWLDNDLVCPNPIGGPSAASTSYHALRKLLVKANLPRIRFHDLRHTCATLLLRAKVNPKVVSELLGHSSVAITLDIYSHVLPDMQDDATAAMTAILGDEES
jgi:integrase